MSEQPNNSRRDDDDTDAGYRDTLEEEAYERKEAEQPDAPNSSSEDEED